MSLLFFIKQSPTLNKLFVLILKKQHTVVHYLYYYMYIDLPWSKQIFFNFFKALYDWFLLSSNDNRFLSAMGERMGERGGGSLCSILPPVKGCQVPKKSKGQIRYRQLLKKTAKSYRSWQIVYKKD